MYNDEKLPSLEDYQKMASAYSQNLKKHGFLFMSIDNSNENSNAQNVLLTLQMIKSSLLSLSGFLGTSKLYSLTEKHIEKIAKWYGDLRCYQTFRVSHDKTKCFLNMISLENQLVFCLIELAKSSSHALEILDIIQERTYLSSNLFMVKGVISSPSGF